MNIGYVIYIYIYKVLKLEMLQSIERLYRKVIYIKLQSENRLIKEIGCIAQSTKIIQNFEQRDYVYIELYNGNKFN